MRRTPRETYFEKKKDFLRFIPWGLGATPPKTFQFKQKIRQNFTVLKIGKTVNVYTFTKLAFKKSVSLDQPKPFVE